MAWGEHITIHRHYGHGPSMTNDIRKCRVCGKRTVEKEEREMPCRDPKEEDRMFADPWFWDYLHTDDEHKIEMLQTRLDERTAMLCRVMTAIDEQEDVSLPAEVWKWWKEHQEWDRKRQGLLEPEPKKPQPKSMFTQTFEVENGRLK